MPAEWPLSFSALLRLPSLRHLHVRGKLFGAWGDRRSPPFSLNTSLASMRHLTRISLFMSEYPPNSFDATELKLLATLPVLASLVMHHVIFGSGDEETLAEWLALRGDKQGRKRNAREQNEKDGKEAVEAGEAEKTERNEPSHRRKEDDPNLLKRWSPLLLFLHALATKPSFVHLRLDNCDLIPFVLDNMAVWPHLLSLSRGGAEQA